MLMRVGAFHALVLGDQVYSAGDTFDVPDAAASTWLRTGLVAPADGVWPEDLADSDE